MAYYEVLIADSKYRGGEPLTYSYDADLPDRCLVTVPVRGRMVNGFIYKKVKQPAFKTLPIKSTHDAQLPPHSFELANWLAEYYACSLGESMRQFAPAGNAPKRSRLPDSLPDYISKLNLDSKLTPDQSQAIAQIKSNPARTIILHGETGSGKTRVYIELAKEVLATNRSVILLTPEIALTSQLAGAVNSSLNAPLFVIHSKLTPAQRKKIWHSIANSTEPVVVIGPRSALFSPIKHPGLIVIDESHEPAYKQDQSPRYHASRVASKLAELTDSKVILGSATPLVSDYYLADKHQAIVRMTKLAASPQHTKVPIGTVDLRDKSNHSSTPYLSQSLLQAATSSLENNQQVMIYLNRRGTARQILCTNCGWQLLCPNCDIPLVYHHDQHRSICHSCGHTESPPSNCPVCRHADLIYKSAGTKLLADNLQRLFPHAKLQRFDSDNASDETLQQLYEPLRRGQIDIIVGTQLLAKGLDLPKLGFVGVISADHSLSMPDFSSGERAFQLLYQVLGRVGRGHGAGQAIIQTYSPDDSIIQAAISKDWPSFYQATLAERQKFGFPPAVYLLKLTCKRATSAGAKSAAGKLKHKIAKLGLAVSVIGPAPSFYARRGQAYYWQLAVKSKNRQHLLQVAKLADSGWSVDLDPLDLL